MTEFSSRRLCWFGLGWAAELPGFSHGTNGHCACAGPGRWELLPQPGSLQPSGCGITQVWVWSSSWHCHSFYPSSVSILPKWAVKAPALAVSVMAWAVLVNWKGFAALTSCLFRSSKGKPKENLAISPILSFIPHSHAFEGIKSGSLFPVKLREIKHCS